MRSQLLARRPRSLVKTQSINHRALLSSTHALRYPRKDSGSSTAIPTLSKRISSSVTSSIDSDAPLPPALPNPAEPPEDDAEDRSRASVATRDADSAAPLPSGLEIVWTPNDDPADPLSSSHTHALPPPEIFDEILHNFHVTLHPRTQHHAAYPSSSNSPVEPTLALYCPIEGGDVYIDETVRELARRTGSEVVVIDSVQLAAGVSGQFGKAASVLQIPNNPLHFTSPPGSISKNNARPAPVYDDDDWEDASSFMVPTRMTVQVLTPVPSRQGRAMLATPPRNGSMAKLKQFFDDIINVPAEASTTEGSHDSPAIRRPRIIYIRDFSVLASSSSIWYPALLAAVRQRRQEPISQPSSPVFNPTTIVFGIIPSIVAPPPPNMAGSGQQGLINMLTARHAGSSTGAFASKPPKSEYGEDAASDRARERRTMNRLKRWARGEAFHDLPQLAANEDGDELSNARGKPEVVVVGGPDGFANLPAVLGPAPFNLSGVSPGRNQSQSTDPDSRTRFFRTLLLVPNVRTPSLERATRIARRREINELTIRMAVAAVGGELGKMEPIEVPEQVSEPATVIGKEHRMWDEWAKTVEPWSVVRRIADRVVGSVVASRHAQGPIIPSLEPTLIPWSAVYEAWTTEKATQELWKSMLVESPQKIFREHEEEEEGKDEGDEGTNVDEVVERVKRDPELDSHEARLLGSIVDASSLNTTFKQVYLPEDTIDAVRTIVSLPLLYPAAFQTGLLKEHRMSGCLLFGPPGTGKTLVVRALAKEAGCRMLAIKPSDVMDMYVGEGEKLVKAVFSLARKLSPCVVFIDELDALFGARVSRDSGGGIAHRGVITEFMQEMDGLKSSQESNVIVIGATNRPFDLDDAVLRRLPRRLLVDLPGEKEREEILKILLRDETLADVDLKRLARQTETFSGSDLKHLCVAAVLDAVKERVNVPWRPSLSTSSDSSSLSPSTSSSSTSDTEESPSPAAISTDNSDDKATPTGDTSKAVEDASLNPEEPSPIARVISWHNFEKALKEITPSASESLGTLADLRKWNEEFGEGRKQRKQRIWGKGKFGFTIEPVDDTNAARVAALTIYNPKSNDPTDS